MLLSHRVAAEHLEELSFALQTRFALETSEDDADTDERIEAHVDGLRFSGEEGVEVMTEQLGGFDLDDVLAAAYALASLPELDGAIDAALNGFTAATEEEALAAFKLAFRHALHPELPALLRPLLAHERATVRAATAEILGYRRAVAAQPLWPMLQDPEPCVRRAAFQAMVRVGGPGDWPPLEQAAFARPEGPSDEERVDLVRLGSSMALDQCRDRIKIVKPSASDLVLLGLAGAAADLALLIGHLSSRTLRLALIDAFGLLGDARAVTVLIGFLDEKSEEVRAAAGVALDRMTGAGLRETIEVRDEPPPEPGPSSSSSVQSAPLASSADAPGSTAAPEPGDITRVERPATSAAVWRAWWKQNGARFLPAIRHRYGRPFSLGQCIDDLTAPGRSPAARQWALWELEIRSGARLPFEPDAPSAIRRQQIAAWHEWWRRNGAKFPDGKWPFQGVAA